MEKIDVESTSSHSAMCSDIVLREGKRVRLIFRPEIVDNRDNPEARVRGRFIYLRKGDAGSWEEFEKIALSSLKKGEGFQLELHSGEVLALRHDLYELARLPSRNRHSAGTRAVFENRKQPRRFAAAFATRTGRISLRERRRRDEYLWPRASLAVPSA